MWELHGKAISLIALQAKIFCLILIKTLASNSILDVMYFIDIKT